MSDEEILDIPVGELIPFVHQSREVFDETELRSLAEDIKANGQLQPGVAWFDPGRGKYVLICGERRLRALKMALLPTMQVKVMQGNLTQGKMLAINLSENLQKASLNAVERAKSFQRLALLENLTSRQVAERMHVSDATVSRDLAILDLPELLQTQFSNGTLPVSVAAELRRVGDVQAQLELAAAITAGRMNRDQLIEVVRSRVGKKNVRPKASRLVVKHQGVCVTVTADRVLTRELVLATCDRIRQEGKKLPEESKEPALSETP